MNLLEHILGTAGLLYGVFLAILFIAAILFVSRKRLRQRSEIAAMEDVDEDGPPLEVSPVEQDAPALNYDPAVQPVDWDEYAGDPNEPPDNVRLPGSGEKMVRVEAGANVFEIDLLRATLLSAGIWAFVDGDRDSLGPVGIAKASLHVPEADVDRATQLIADARRDARERRADSTNAAGLE